MVAFEKTNIDNKLKSVMVRANVIKTSNDKGISTIGNIKQVMIKFSKQKSDGDGKCSDPDNFDTEYTEVFPEITD